MPTYTTLETISEVMEQGQCITWRIFDEDENQLHFYTPPVTTKWRDSFNTLKAFISGFTGTGYLMIRIYDPSYKKGTKGGDTSTTIFTYYYKLSPGAGSKSAEPAGMGGDYMALFTQISDLKRQMEVDAKQREIDELKKELKNDKKSEGDYFERVAKVIGKEMGKEWLKAEGYELDDDDVPIGKVKSKKSVSGTIDDDDKKEPPKDAKEAFKRTADATVRVMKVAKNLGSNYGEVAESFEEIAQLAEKDPVKLKQLFDELKKKEKK